MIYIIYNIYNIYIIYKLYAYIIYIYIYNRYILYTYIYIPQLLTKHDSFTIYWQEHLCVCDSVHRYCRDISICIAHFEISHRHPAFEGWVPVPGHIQPQEAACSSVTCTMLANWSKVASLSSIAISDISKSVSSRSVWHIWLQWLSLAKKQSNTIPMNYHSHDYRRASKQRQRPTNGFSNCSIQSLYTSANIMQNKGINIKNQTAPPPS